MPIKEIRSKLISVLQEFWQRGCINTRYAVTEFCVGYYGKVDEVILDVIESLYKEGYIKA